jgi:hypothetical protein
VPKKINYLEKLQALDGALVERRNIHATVLQTCSPSLNFIFGKGWGLPRGHSIIYYGPPKGGKTLIKYMHIAQMHRDYPEAFAINIDTEFRDEGQLDAQTAAVFGIDMTRYICLQVNHPAKIYDQLCGKVKALVDDGMDLGLVAIDSMSGVEGRRAAMGGKDKTEDGEDNKSGKSSVMTQQIGDVAQTNKEGLKHIIEFQRSARFGLVMTAHVAVEMDMIEQKRGNKFRMGASVGVQHHAEYFAFVEMDRRKAAKQDLLGQDFAAPLLDMNKRSEQTGHKIAVTMKDSTFGPKGRSAEFTLDYRRGVINQWEELYVLARRRGIVAKPNQQTYEISGFPVVKGEENFIQAFRDNADMHAHTLKELKRQDVEGISATFDAKDAAEWAAPEGWSKDADAGPDEAGGSM